MMMRVFFVTLMLTCFSDSKPMLNFNPRVKTFLKERHRVSGHRMNFSTTEKKDSKKTFVVEVDSISKMQSLIAVSLKGKFDVIKNDDYSLRIKNENFRVAMNKVKKDEQEFSQLVLRKLLPNFIAKQFDILSIDIEQEFDFDSGNVEAVGYILNYQRVYNNRIVRSPCDYLTIAIDSDGKLKWADIMMSDLKTTQEYIETEEGVEENEDALNEVISTTVDSLENIKTHEKKGVQSVAVNSAAEAYCIVEDGGKMKMHPCISYAATMQLDNGDVVPAIIDAPHSLKTWRNYKNGKKKYIHYANMGTSNSMFVLRK